KCLINVDFVDKSSYPRLICCCQLSCNTLNEWRFPWCNTIGHSVSPEVSMRDRAHAGWSLYSSSGRRKYLNAAERRRFANAARDADSATRLFCLVLGCSGARISEVLALTPASFDIESRAVSIITLKRRASGIVRQVPLPGDIIGDLNRVFRLR